MKKIKRRKKEEEKEEPPRTIKRRKVTIERLSSTGKCKKCENLFQYNFEGEKKSQIESNPKRVKRFNELMDSELCLKCLTSENNSIKAYEIMELWVLKGDPMNTAHT